MSGTLRTVGQVDTYNFTLIAGFTYEFDLFGQGSGNGTLLGASLQLVGLKTVTEGSSGEAQVTFTPTSSGTYQLKVSASGSNTGSYNLVESPADDYGDTASTTTGKLAIGGSTTGVIAPAGDDDLFAVTLVSGVCLPVRPAGPGQRQQHAAGRHVQPGRNRQDRDGRQQRPTPGSATRRRPAAPTTSTSRPAPPAPGPIR